MTAQELFNIPEILITNYFQEFLLAAILILAFPLMEWCMALIRKGVNIGGYR